MPSTYRPERSQKSLSIDMSWNSEEPYNSLPPLPPAVELETGPILKQCIASRAALAALNESADHLPNRELLVNVMPLLEAQASSEIENIVTTTDRLFRSSLLEGGSSDPATKEALSYRNALYEGFRSMEDKPVCTATAERICSAIKGKEMRVRQVPGTTLRSDRSGKTIYTPPVGEDLIRHNLANWERFFHDAGSLDPLVALAVGHYQFEAIHPFTDGNGRTGRILNLLHLVNSGLLKSPILYHSGSIIRRKEDYYRNLTAVTVSGAWENWILYMLEVIEHSAEWTFRKVAAIRDLRRAVKRKMKAELPKLYSAELLDVIFHQPYCRIGDVVEADIAKRQAASTYLKQLVETGLLAEEKVGREKLFIHGQFLKLLMEPDNES